MSGEDGLETAVDDAGVEENAKLLAAVAVPTLASAADLRKLRRLMRTSRPGTAFIQALRYFDANCRTNFSDAGQNYF
jgi:hypothetical protein